MSIIKRNLIVLCFISALFFPFMTTISDAQTDSPFFVVLCDDGRQIVGYRIILDDLTPRSFLRITAVGAQNFDPAFAVIDQDGESDCTNNDPSAANTIIAVPGIGRVEATDFAAQMTASVSSNGALDLVVGGFPGQSGQFALVIEDLTIDPPSEADRLTIQVPPAAQTEWLNVFMVSGQTGRLDPHMELFFNQQGGQPEFECDNAGTITCVGVPNLIDRGAVISQESAYSGDSFDAGIIGAFGQEELYYDLRDATGTNTGEYALIISATAPGAVIDTSLICDNVATDIQGSSPSYNATYTTDYLLDGDPSTFWATGAAPLDAQSGTRNPNSFVVVGVEASQRINKIRINGYAQSNVDIETNALKRFAVRFPNIDGEVVTALEAELLLQPGYQTFTFLPATIDELGIILLDNYGGTLFTLVDIQICAAP